MTARMFIGGPDEIAGQIKEAVLDKGIDGLTINMLANGPPTPPPSSSPSA
jgi:hypothetical protein